jgi:sialate O-acetylesterase
MRKTALKLQSILLFTLLPVAVQAQVTLPKILSDHMVVQRELAVHVWGLAEPGETVSVDFRGESRTVTTDGIGHWSVYLKPGSAGGPFEMKVQGGKANEATITIHDVLVGDVWVASGQSNMEMPLKGWPPGSPLQNSAKEIANANQPLLRLLIVKQKSSEYPVDDIDASWTLCTPQTAGEFSAVAYFFGRDLAAKERVPIGLIQSAWGGTPAEAWVRLTALGDDAALNPLFASRGRMIEDGADAARQIADEQKQIAEAKAAGKPVPQFPWHASLPSWGPGNLWNGMIAPLTPFPVRGAIWYQGESNASLERFPIYNRIMRALIEDWRREWAVGDFPFLYVQIASFKADSHDEWANLRQQQVETLGLKNTAMAVTVDIGTPDTVHPPDKVDVGHRLALAARALSYGEMLEYSGPLFRQAVPDGGAVRVWFDHAKGLNAKGGPLTGVEVAGKDGKFVPAKAVIEGETILASNPDVPQPAAVRYGWAGNPQCNLFNGEGLPASPFTSVKPF